MWEPLCRLALSDGRQEVLAVLQRGARSDKHIARVCDFLRGIPALHQLEEVSTVEFRQVLRQMIEGGQKVLRTIPAEHPVRPIMEVYAGPGKRAFEEGKDVAKKWGRTWIEDFAYAHAWVHPDLRRSELSDLLLAVSQRRSDEEIDEVDRALFLLVMLEIPEMLSLLSRSPERYPAVVLTHLVDILYFAGRLPGVTGQCEAEKDSEPAVTSRDWHLQRYAEELLEGPRQMRRCAMSYLRAGGTAAARDGLEAAFEKYAETAISDEETEEALALLADLGLSAELGVRLCTQKAGVERRSGHICKALHWGGKAEEALHHPTGFVMSELLDDLAATDLQSLLDALAPPDPDEPLDFFPPRWLQQRLLLPAVLLEGGRIFGRLYFYVQLARCRAARTSRVQAAEWASHLAYLVVCGRGSHQLALRVLSEDLEPVLSMEQPPLTAEEVLKLMHFVQRSASDPLHRACLSQAKEHHLLQVLASGLSRVILNTPVVGPAFSRAFSPAPVGSGGLHAGVMMAGMHRPPLQTVAQ